jgi:hypothetical protein
LELVQFVEGIIVSLRSHLVLERVKNSLSCVREVIRIFRVTPQQPACAEASVRSTHHLAEAMTLLPGVLDLRRHQLPDRRHLAEPRCYWKNLQVGSRTRHPHHRLQATHSHQVASSSRLHGRVAGESATYSSRATRALGDVLRWLTQPRGRRCRGTPDFSDEDTNYITRTSTPAAPEAPRTSTPAAPEAPQVPSTPLGAPPA